MRMLGHAIHDGAEYVPTELLDEWKQRDPLGAYRARLSAEGVGDDELQWHEARAKSVVEAAVKQAEADPLPDPSTLMDGVYA